MSLTPDQERAARRLGQDVCVTAGPGSGKTRVLIQRFLWLVCERQVSPSRILTITFTEKATTEIRKRLVKAFEDSPELRRAIEHAYVSTVHGFCARLLHENAVAAGLDPEFAILDERQGELLLWQAAEEVLNGMFEERPARFRSLLEALDVATEAEGRQWDLVRSLLSVYEALRIAGEPSSALQAAQGAVEWEELKGLLKAVLEEKPGPLTPNQCATHDTLREHARDLLSLLAAPAGRTHFERLERIRINAGHLKKGSLAREAAKEMKSRWIPMLVGEWVGSYYGAERDLLVEAVARIDECYRKRKRSLAALDFSDLEEQAIDVLQQEPLLRERIRSSFDYILMDELQDTNPLQWKLLDLIRTPSRFFAVGDINQSIFGFRHAEPEIFQSYRESVARAGHTVDALRENHRTRAEILETVNATFGGAAGVEPHVLTAARQFPAQEAPAVELIVGMGEAGEEAAEIQAEWLACRIRELEGSLAVAGEGGTPRPARFSDMAVLARTVNAFDPLRRALQKFEAPYLLTGGKSFFESREVRDLTLWLAVLANPLDEIALAGVLRSPLAGIGDESLLRLRQSGPLWKALADLNGMGGAEWSDGELERLRAVRDQIGRSRRLRDEVSPDRLAADILDASGYEETLDSRGRANVEKLFGLLRALWRREPRPLGEILEEMRRLRSSESEPEAPPDDSANAVRLMTIHQAKGLEFPIVFVHALERGADSSVPPVCFEAGTGLGARWRNPATGKAAPDARHNAAGQVLQRKQDEEEIRLLYVALTRAAERLVLAFSKSSRSRSEWVKLIPGGLGLDAESLVEGVRLHRAGPEGPAVRIQCSGERPVQSFPPAPSAPGLTEVVLKEPVITSQYDSVCTVTALAAFQSCPRRYYLSSYLGWRGSQEPPLVPVEGVHDELDASELGVQVHRLLAGVAVEQPAAEALELAEVFRRSALGRRSARAARVEREFDFLLALENVVLRGQVDLWFEEEGETILVDYKTDRIDPGRETGRVDAYSLQLRLYALALRSVTGKLPDRAFLYFLRPDLAVEVDLSERGLGETAETVRDFREAQSKSSFPLREGQHCCRCPFYEGLCPAGR